MNHLSKYVCLIVGMVLASSASAQSGNVQSSANARSNPGVQAAKNRVENITNYGTVKSTNTYTVNKSTDAAQISREQNAVEKQRQQDVAKKYSATGKPVPVPGK